MAIAGLGELLALAWCAFCILLLAAYLRTIGWVVQWLAVAFEGVGFTVLGIPFHPLRFLVGPLEGFNNQAQNALYFWLNAAQGIWNDWVQQSATFVSAVTDGLDYLATETGKALHVLRRAAVPALIGATFGPIADEVYALRKRIAALAGAVAGAAVAAPTIIKHYVYPTTTKVVHVTKTVYRTLPVVIHKAVAIPFPRIGQLEREAETVGKRVKAIAKTLTPAGVVGLIGAAVFTKFDLNYLRCSGVRGVGRRLCGLGGFLEELLATAFASFVVSDLCLIVSLAVDGASEAQGVLHDIFDLIDGLIQCRGWQGAQPLHVNGVKLATPVNPLHL